MRVYNIIEDNPVLAAQPGNQIYFSLRHFPDLRQSMNQANKNIISSGDHVLTKQYRLGSAYRSKSPLARERIGRHNGEKIYAIQNKMDSLRHSSWKELTILRDVRDQIRLTTIANRRPATSNIEVATFRPRIRPTTQSLCEKPTSLTATQVIPCSFTPIETMSTYDRVLKKFQTSGFPGILDKHGQYGIDGDGLLAVLGISRRIPRSFKTAELQDLILNTLGLQFTEKEIDELRERVLT